MVASGAQPPGQGSGKPVKAMTTGPGPAKVRASLKATIPFHIKGLKACGAAVPPPESAVEWVEV